VLLDNGYKHINGNGNPDLGLHRILRGPIKCFDPKVLLDPFEKQFNLPTAAIELGNGQSRKSKVFGYKHQPFVVLGVEVTNPSQLFGIIFLRVETLKRNNLSIKPIFEFNCMLFMLLLKLSIQTVGQ